jgi:hypothetical protein
MQRFPEEVVFQTTCPNQILFELLDLLAATDFSFERDLDLAWSS